MLTGDDNTKYHIGTNALSYPREKAEVVMPLKDGMSKLLLNNFSCNKVGIKMNDKYIVTSPCCLFGYLNLLQFGREIFMVAE